MIDIADCYWREMADPFEEPLHLEGEHLREGYEEGVK